jgi:hypothetical protein
MTAQSAMGRCEAVALEGLCRMKFGVHLPDDDLINMSVNKYADDIRMMT